MSSWEERRLTITADELLRKHAPLPGAPSSTPPAPSGASWVQRKLAGSGGWPWREIGGTVAVCVIAAAVIALVLNSGWTLPSLPRRRPVPALTTVEPTVTPTARVVQVEQPPVVIIVTATPQAIPAQPVQVAPVAPARQVVPPVAAQPVNPRPVEHRPTARPQPTAVPTRPANVQAAPVPGPQERLLSRPCQFPDAPQGTVIRGYYTDAQGVKRDAVCRADGWKAAD